MNNRQRWTGNGLCLRDGSCRTFDGRGRGLGRNPLVFADKDADIPADDAPQAPADSTGPGTGMGRGIAGGGRGMGGGARGRGIGGGGRGKGGGGRGMGGGGRGMGGGGAMGRGLGPGDGTGRCGTPYPRQGMGNGTGQPMNRPEPGDSDTDA